jgi:fibronectin type 3 domain-containing protein
LVEGTDCYNGDCDWWGGNLEGAQAFPVVLNTPNHVVYSAHDYGPNLFGQSWFNSNTTDSSLVGVWTKFWGYLNANGIAPVWVGEFGTTNNNSDIENSTPGSQGQWFQSLVSFLQSNPAINWTYWALNGEDSYALLDSNYDPTPANALKQQLLASIQFPLSGGGTGGQPTPPAAPSNLSASAVSANQINLNWTASATSGVTYNVYVSTTSGFAPSAANRAAGGITSTSFQQQGLLPSTTYYYLVTAVDSGGESVASNQASATTQASGSGGTGCQVAYADTNDWGSGFTGSVSITNTGNSSINGWSLTWTWTGNQQITQSWNANYAQSGPAVTLTNASWNASIAPGATVSGIGFNANYSGTNAAPAAFYLNGARCGGAAGGSNVPAAPSNLSATAASASQINLSWTASSTAGVTYDVYAGTSSAVTASPGFRVATGITGTTFQHTSLSASTTYYYLATAVNAAGESAASNQASATTQANTVPPPVPPTGLSAQAISSSQINLSWNASTSPGVTYNLYENTTANFSAANRIATNITATTFQQQGLKPSTTYYFVATAVNSAGESAYSNQASAATQGSSSGGSCHISYTDQNDWGTGFTGNISITNTSTATIQGWHLVWTWPGNQQIVGAWNATSNQTGNQVTFGSLSYNGTISPGATISGIGFNANYSGSNSAPSAFYLNGALCH